MVTGQTTTAGITAETETGTEEEEAAATEETTGEDTNKGINMAMTEVDKEEDTSKGIITVMTEPDTEEDTSKGIITAMTEEDIEEATPVVAEGVAKDKEEAELVVYNSITNVLREETISKETKLCRETIMGMETLTAIITKSSNLKYLLIPLRRSRKISTW